MADFNFVPVLGTSYRPMPRGKHLRITSSNIIFSTEVIELLKSQSKEEITKSFIVDYQVDQAQQAIKLAVALKGWRVNLQSNGEATGVLPAPIKRLRFERGMYKFVPDQANVFQHESMVAAEISTKNGSKIHSPGVGDIVTWDMKIKDGPTIKCEGEISQLTTQKLARNQTKPAAKILITSKEYLNYYPKRPYVTRGLTSLEVKE